MSHSPHKSVPLALAGGLPIRLFALCSLLLALGALPFIAKTRAAEDSTHSPVLSIRYFPREDVYTRIRLKTGTANPFAPLVIYTWIGGSSTFNTATNWSPNRTTPATG